MKVEFLTILLVIGTCRVVSSQDFDGPRPSGSHSSGVNIASYYNTNIQLTAKTHSASHGILFNSYYPSGAPSGSLLTPGNIKYAHGAAQYGGGAGAIVFFGNGGNMDFYVSPASTGAGDDVIWGVSKLRITRGGNLGIGITDPEEKLQIDGNLSLNAFGNGTESGIYFRDGFNSTSNNKYNLSILSYDDGDGTSDALGINAYDGIYFNTGSNSKNTKMLINSSGNVGIGTTNPDPNFKLSVNGSIRSKEVKVEANWSDFVFEDDYELRTLEEVEQHINENGHLPEIPSEAEVTENGINLGEMNAKLLQKIEELTLYMIDMSKRVNQLEHENTELKESNQELKEDISTLKSN